MFTEKIYNFKIRGTDVTPNRDYEDIEVFENSDVTINCDVEQTHYDFETTIPHLDIYSHSERPNDKLIISKKSDILEKLRIDYWDCDPVEEIFIPLILNNFRLSSDDIKDIINDERILELIDENDTDLKLLLQFISDPDKLIQIISDSNFKYNTHYSNSWVKDYLLFVKDVNQLEDKINLIQKDYLSGTRYIFDKATEKELELLNYVKVPYRLHDDFILPAAIAEIECIDDGRAIIKSGYSQPLINISDISREFHNTIFKHNFVEVLSDYDEGLEILKALDTLEKALQDKSFIDMGLENIHLNSHNKEIIHSHKLVKYLF